MHQPISPANPLLPPCLQNRGYLYYSAGLLSRVDKYPDHQRFMAGTRRKKNKEKREKERLRKVKKEEDEEDVEPEVGSDDGEA